MHRNLCTCNAWGKNTTLPRLRFLLQDSRPHILCIFWACTYNSHLYVPLDTTIAMPRLPHVFLRFTIMCGLASGLQQLSIVVCTGVPLYVWWHMFTDLIHRQTLVGVNVSLPPSAWVHKTTSISEGAGRMRALCRTAPFPALSRMTTPFFLIASKGFTSCLINSFLSFRQSPDECRSRRRQVSCLRLANKN